MAIDKSRSKKAGQVIDPNMESDLVASKAIKSIEVDGDNGW